MPASQGQVDDDFSSNVMSLSYDTEGDQGGSPKGNLTLDTAGAAKRHRSRSDRRASLEPLSQGLTNDGGNTTVHYYYAGSAGV